MYLGKVLDGQGTQVACHVVHQNQSYPINGSPCVVSTRHGGPTLLGGMWLVLVHHVALQYGVPWAFNTFLIYVLCDGLFHAFSGTGVKQKEWYHWLSMDYLAIFADPFWLAMDFTIHELRSVIGFNLDVLAMSSYQFCICQSAK